ncbi:hypothetical protein D1AOALGA4SA_2904 [Olavius algarvensis Delta 1 endosymbiont]|nr:hypothetical protein D1AOALGA4SA_2904 [Olavius algarvensis Delta 1 endosymbiont]
MDIATPLAAGLRTYGNLKVNLSAKLGNKEYNLLFLTVIRR